MKTLLIFLAITTSVSLARNLLQKSYVDRQRYTVIIPLFSNEVTFIEFEEMWLSVQNENQNDTLCYFLPTKSENSTFEAYLSQARTASRSTCGEWKRIRDQHNIIIMTNVGNCIKKTQNDLISVLNKGTKEHCELDKLPIGEMLLSLSSILVFVLLAAVLATISVWWRRNHDQKMVQKLKFVLAMTGNFASDEIKKVANLWEKMYIDGKFVEVKNDIRGKGSSSIVFDAILNTKAPIADLYPCLETEKFKHCPAVIKIVNNFGPNEFKSILKEVTVALKIKWHKNVCCLLGWSIYLETYSLIYECIDGGDLLSWIRRFTDNKAVVTDEQKAKILWQITNGMEYISLLGIVHRDLAARNILMTNNFEVKISDFGLASFCNIDSLYHAQTNQKLPIRWMSVEAFCQVFSEASDIWSFGILTWELLTFGEIPYGEMTNEEIIKFVVDGRRLIIPATVGQPWQMLTHDCWKHNRKDRPTFTAIKMLLRNYLTNKTVDYGYYSCEQEKC